MESYQDYISRVKALQNWERRVANMKTFDIPDHFDSAGIRGKYNRFTGFMSDWIWERLVSTNVEDIVAEDENDRKFSLLPLNLDMVTVNWWKNAVSGKRVENVLPKLENPTANDKETVYDTFMPAYRALKESFEKRWKIEYIFNHAQYTAERDSLKALENVMKNLTGDGKEGIDAAYAKHKASLPYSNINEALKFFKNQEAAKNADISKNDAERLSTVSRESISCVVDKDINQTYSSDRSPTHSDTSVIEGQIKEKQP
jgi:hypothetical protein